jgi:hypothetical protein
MIRLLGTSKMGEPESSGRHIEIAAHRQPGEAHIDPVDVSQEVAQNGERQQAYIDLAHGRFFDCIVHPFFSFVRPPRRPTGGRKRRCRATWLPIVGDGDRPT